MKFSPRVREFSLRARLAALRGRHQELKERIVQELKRPAPCSIQLQRLKRRKVRVKDELARHEGLLRTLNAMAGNSRFSSRA